MTTYAATVRRAVQTTLGKGMAGNGVIHGIRSIELVAAASGSTVDFKLRIPTNARIDLSSKVIYDDLATSGAPTLDIGLKAVDANVTTKTDALNDGLTVATAITYATAAPVVKDFANAGKQAWEYTSATSDPGGFLDVIGTIRDAATTQTGSVTLDLKTYFD